MNLEKLERYLRVNLLGPGPRLVEKEFTEPRPHNVEKQCSRQHRINVGRGQRIEAHIQSFMI